MSDDDVAVPSSGENAVPVGIYPIEWEADVVLRDGSTTHVRPIRPDDAEALQKFHVAQSERSIYMRFFAPLARLPERDLRRFTVVDYMDRVALIAVSTASDDENDAETIIGVARFDRIESQEAEVAFNVADSQQGKGVGTVLLEHIATAARERGIRRFTAEVLMQNRKMLAIFREAGYQVTQEMADGVVTLVIDLDPTEKSRSVMAERERRAEARSIEGLFASRSVVVVTSKDGGPTQQSTRLARRAIDNLIASKRSLAETGDAENVENSDDPGVVPDEQLRIAIVGVEPALQVPAEGVDYYDALSDVPGPVDLAVLSVPAEQAPRVVRGLAHLEVRGIVLLSEGFAETGPDGLGLQRTFIRAAHMAGMRVIGPGSYGLLNTAGGAPINATVADQEPRPGNVGVFCQSAATAVTLLASVNRRGLGISSFLSAGNRADVSGNDLMQFWQEDSRTEVVCLFLESIGNPRKFSRIARRLSLVKPVVVVTAGKSGHVVPPGHAVRTTRAPRRTLEEMLRQAGVIRAENTHQMIDIAQLLDSQPLPRGKRVGIVANSAALAALVAEAAASAGLIVSTADIGIVAEDASDEQVLKTIDHTYSDENCDAVVAVNIPILGTVNPVFGTAIAAAAARTGRTTVASVLGSHGLVEELRARTPEHTDAQIPAYATPEDAVLALAAVVRYAAWRDQDHGTFVEPDGVDEDAARELVEAWCTGTDDVVLDSAQVAQLLSCYGIGVEPSREVDTIEEAVVAGHELGWPVVLKSTVEALRHRADLGGVRLDIPDEAALRADFLHMSSRLETQIGRPSPLEVQSMVTEGVACVIRSTEDPLFGPVVSFGLAGDAVDLLGDVSYAIPPLTDVDVAAMVHSVRAAPRLFGYRGLPAMDTDALEDLLARISQLADHLPEVRQLELHPAVVAIDGARVVGARIVLGRSKRPDETRRALAG